MPYFKRDESIIHFVHIPKNAGKSVCKLLKMNGWKADDSMHKNIPIALMDHVHFSAYEQYKIDSKYEFAIVRNPSDRFLSSVYFLIRQWNNGIGCIPENPTDEKNVTGKQLIHFMHSIFTKIIPKHGIHVENNFYLPQHLFISPKTHIFKYEDHLPDLLIRELSDRKLISKESILPHINVSFSRKAEIDWDYAPDVSNYFFNLYGLDYELFDYEKPKFVGSI
jgi:hypothetical protein